MNNAEKFKQIFGLYATELWSMPESDFLAWLNRDVETTQIDHTADIGKKVSISCGQENDMVSRQAAIDALKGLPTWWADEGGYYGGAQPPMVALLDPEDAVSAIENLPSARPATSCSEIPNGSDDTISRQAAIDALDIAIERYDEIAEKYRKKADIERNDYMDMRDNAYEAQQLAQWLNELKYLREKIEQITIKPEQKWIPCSERMPEEGQKCLVYDKAIGFRVDTYIGHGNPYNWELFVRDYEAWMLIPKLTGGDSE